MKSFTDGLGLVENELEREGAKRSKHESLDNDRVTARSTMS